jgi:methionine-rich copper-binding protein CopC
VIALVRRVALTVALLLAAPNAWPHAFLAGAAPSAGSAFATAPAQLTLRFTEAVEPMFCAVELVNPAGAAMTVEVPHLAAGNAQALVVALPKLPPGTYTVIWHVTSVDTHKTEGRYQFTVGP